jgi:hypothetical protein
MWDERRFKVRARGADSEPMPIMAARQIATDIYRHGEKVRIVNARTGEVFRWWPELGVHSV